MKISFPSLYFLNGVAVGYSKVTVAYSKVAVGYSKVTVAYSKVAVGYSIV